MDPTTTLITFMFHTAPTTKSVDLVGSWDNFSKRYTMDKDPRRGLGQWRGVHSFKDITCDGERPNESKRNGGLKMGHTYWYYYELNDGTETHDTAHPSTTSCPYLPGQPVNLLHVPVQISPLRERSASEGAMTRGIETMNPADKYLTPRAPPAIPKPQLRRLDTSPAILTHKNSTRSASPNGPRSPWSARSLFGLKAPMSALPDSRDRGRVWSPVTQDTRELGLPKSSSVSSPLASRSLRSNSESATALSSYGSRDASSRPATKPMSRDPSPLRHATAAQEILSPVPLTIPDEITEEDYEDDANFASPVDNDKVAVTSLSPPPTKQFQNILAPLADTKPLPKLPEESSSPSIEDSPTMVPAPLQLSHLNATNPRSHFSIDTISTGMVSPTDSHFSSPPSIYNSEDGDLATDDSFTFHSGASAEASPPNGFTNDFQYSLPEGDFGSELTLRKGGVGNPSIGLDGVGSKMTVRTTFGPQTFAPPEKMEDAMSALDQLLEEMGYLGDFISGK